MAINTMRHRSRWRQTAVALAVALALAGCSAPSDAPGRVRLDFFQFKGEAAGIFEELVAEFEAANPDIDVVINQAPDPDTAIRTLLVKGRAPDVITLNANGGFGLLAQAGVFHDFSDDPVLERVNPAVQDVLAELGTYRDTEVNSLGFSSNANAVIYNRAIFREHGIEVPTTWDELVEVMETLDAAGITPVYGTLADAWTTQPVFNTLGASVAKDGFFDDLRALGSAAGPDAETSFSRDWAGVLDRMLTIYSFAQTGYRSATYDSGNAAMARGEAAMLLQGNWAVPQIQAVNPDIELGMFPMPADDAADTVVVSGVDVAVTIARDTPHQAEAMRFVEFLFSEDVLERYAADQSMISTSATSPGTTDPVLVELQPWFDEGRLWGFVDHQIPPAVPLGPILQQAVLDDDPGEALRTLDNQWRGFAARTLG